jgi:hypothetical protein
MTTMKGHLYLQYLAYGNRARNGAPLRNYISELSAGGTVLKVSPPEPTGAWLTALGATIYAVGAGNTCDSGLVIWRVAPTTLRTTPVATIQTPGNPCLGVGAESGRSVAAAAGSLFVLYSFASDTTIYRVTPAS